MGHFLKIGTYNIAACRQIGRDAAIIAADIEKNGLDIVGFQEVDRNADRSLLVDMEKDIKENCSLKYTFYAKTLDLATTPKEYGMGSEDYGIMIASRYPIIKAESYCLPTENAEPRRIIEAQIDVKGRIFNFYTTHFSVENPSLRKAQFEFVAKLLKDKKDFILTGDFNTCNFEDFTVIKNGKTVNNKTNYFASCLLPSGERVAIDNIVYSADFILKKSALFDKDHSDHSLLYADFEW